MSSLDEVRGGMDPVDIYDKLPIMEVIAERDVNGTIVPFKCFAVYDSGSFDAFYTASDEAHAHVRRTSQTMWAHPDHETSDVSDLGCTCGHNIARSRGVSGCPLWQEIPYGGRVKRGFLNWKGKAVLLVGARVVSARWKVRVLVDTNNTFYAVPKDATSLVDAKLLHHDGVAMTVEATTAPGSSCSHTTRVP